MNADLMLTERECYTHGGSITLRNMSFPDEISFENPRNSVFGGSWKSYLLSRKPKQDLLTSMVAPYQSFFSYSILDQEILNSSGQEELVLDDHCIRRLKVFFEYEDNWDGMGAKSISYKSLIQFFNFKYLGEIKNKNPTLFMDPNGHIILNWEFGSEKEVAELGFHVSSISIFKDGMEDDVILPEDGRGIEAYLEGAI
jgi:hypothetical protein